MSAVVAIPTDTSSEEGARWQSRWAQETIRQVREEVFEKERE